MRTVPASVSGAAGYSVYHGYDVRGLLTHARFGSDSGQGVTNTYDVFGWLRTSSNNMGGTACTVNSPNYNAHEREWGEERDARLRPARPVVRACRS